MPIFQLNPTEIFFPPAYLADDSGILAVGGDLYPDRLIAAYQQGTFPWFNPDEPTLWWSPDPRFVIIPSEIKVSKSMRSLFNQKRFRVTMNQDFLGVMQGCRDAPRKEQEGTWITDKFIESYHELHRREFILSVEVWDGEELVGGLYGGCMGKCFFGESMFAKASNASKYGFITLAKHLHAIGFQLIDCQVHTTHLESLGGRFIPRLEFLRLLEKNFTDDFTSNRYVWESFQG